MNNYTWFENEQGDYTIFNEKEDKPVAYCKTVEDAQFIVKALNTLFDNYLNK